MGNDEVCRGEDVDGCRFVDRLSFERGIGETGQLGDARIERALGVFAPDAGLSDLYDASGVIVAETLDGEFDDAVRLVVEPGRLDVEGNADAALAAGARDVEARAGRRSATTTGRS